MAKKIYVHAGAHRSGTSSFQMCLAENRDVLEAQGYDLAYPGRDGAQRGDLKLRFPGGRDPEGKVAIMAERAARNIAAVMTDPARDLILSEENIPGRIYPMFKGRLFRDAAKRAGMVRAALGQDADHLLFVLRPYADLFVSAYRLRAQDNRVRPFAEIVPNLLTMRRGWADVVRDLGQGFGADRITVVEFGQRGQSRDLLRRLAPGLDSLELVEPTGRVNRSPGDAALMAVQARLGEGDADDATLAQVLADHAGDDRDLGFASYAPQDRAQLEARYAADLDKVAALPGITLIA